MPRTEEEQTAFELQCYGMSRYAVDTDFARAIGGPKMVIMGMISDAQELIFFGDMNKARQRLNIVKHLMDTHLEVKP